MKKLTLPLLLAGLSGLAACEDQGPFEQAGEEIDEAVEDVQTPGGEDPVNQIDDAIDEVQDAADEVQDAAEDAVE